MKKCTIFGTVAIACTMIFLVTACFSPLQGVDEGNLAVRVSFPDGIHTMETESLVGRLYVINAAYEVLLRTVLAYEDFLETFYFGVAIEEFNSYPMLLQYYLQLEAIFDDFEEDLILKAPVMFGGMPYFDFSVANPKDGGSVTPPGVPAERAYFVYLDMWVPGSQDNDEADPEYESVAWEVSDPYDVELAPVVDSNLVPGPPFPPTALGQNDAEAVSAAMAIFVDVLMAYRDNVNYPFIPAALVPRGGTAPVALEMRTVE